MVKAAMQQIRIEDVDAWTKDQIGTTLLSKRRLALRACGRKKKKK
jgi:hypothetical protein